MTIAEIAAVMRPEYERADSETERRAVLQRWNEQLETAEPDAPAPDELAAAMAAALRSWERQSRRRYR